MIFTKTGKYITDDKLKPYYDKVEAWRQAMLEAKRYKEECERKLREARRKPILVCGYCKRPWSVCTYMGPVIAGYDEI
jgi:hypothetical protein